MEYKYAISIGKPTIAFLHKDPGTIQAKKCESTNEGKEKLAIFRTFVEQKLCKQWSSPADLGSVVSRSLVQLIKNTTAVGWVRADELLNKDAALELLRLRLRVEELESELARSLTTAPKGSEKLAQGEELHTLRYHFNAYERTTYTTTNWIGEFQATWNSIFASVAPLMINEVSDDDLNAAFNNFTRDQNIEQLEKDKEYKNSSLREFYLYKDDFVTIKVQLRALGLIVKSDKARRIKDVATYWTLTPYGDDTMTRLLAIKRIVIPEKEPEILRTKEKKDG
jgi:hypothetical protein